MKLFSIFVIVAAALLLAACNQTITQNPNNGNASSPTSSGTPDAFAATRALYKKDCEECHGANGSGGRVKLEDGTRLKVPSLREGHALRHPDSDFVKQIEKGGDGMPAFKDKMSAAQITEMISFIRKEFQGGITPPEK